jgi:hypothetical protein
LTGNQKDILKIIARKELANLNTQSASHYNLADLLEECNNETVLTTEVQLRDNLLEIIDHKVVTLSSNN